MGGCERDPRDESMIANFQKHREKFELLRQMVVHDKEDSGNKIENSVPI
jgi:hypothetical protein